MEVVKGMHVIYVDPHNVDRPALVTAMHGRASSGQPSINVAYINNDDAQWDSYGNKIERATSVPYQGDQGAPGNYWKYAVKDAYDPALDVKKSSV